jgi:hypothetical protein
MRPTVGTIVHFGVTAGHATAPRTEPKAAIIAAVHEDDGSVDLVVAWPSFGKHDYMPPVAARERVLFAETLTPGCWSWPPRE